MKNSRRIVLIVLLLVLLLLLGILFGSFLQDNFVIPIALMVWLFRRIILSIDQQIYWTLLILSGVIYTFYRLAREPLILEPDSGSTQNAILETMVYWRISIMLNGSEMEKPNMLKRDLGQLLASIYASRHYEKTQSDIYEALKMRRIPLPDTIYAFLFPGELQASRWSVRRVFRSAGQLPRRLLLRWTGRDKAAYYRSIAEVLDFMESLMEMNNDYKRRSNPND